MLAAVAALVGLGGEPTKVAGQNSPEELVLIVARAKELAALALEDAVSPIGALLFQIGPSGGFAWGDQGFGHFTISLGGRGTPLSITNPDYTAEDPGGADRIESPAGAFYTDLSVGLWPGHQGGKVQGVGSGSLLLRLGYTLGDQSDIVDDLDVTSLKPIYGIGLRLGLLKGAGLPSVSVAVGANFLQRRTFKVPGTAFGGTDSRSFEVVLSLKQSGTFLLGEVGKRFGIITLYGAGGVVGQHLEAQYDSEVWYDANSNSVDIGDDLEFETSSGVFLGGLGFGGTVRLVLEGGMWEGEPFGTFFLSITR
jgi:hypothetical protein